MIKLEAVSENPPGDVATMLEELGTGEAGFGGAEPGRGEMDLEEYLHRTMSETNAETLPKGRVPQTTFWIVEGGKALGMLRMRHELNEARVAGGHIGYYVRPSARKRGLATQALRLALTEIGALGVCSVMLTTNPGNHGSIRVIEENGGTLRAQVPDPDGSDIINQYWIELTQS